VNFKGDINNTLKRLLEQEDTDGDKKITIEDRGPKAFEIILEDNTSYTIQGTYHLSNFLQELALEKVLGKEEAYIPIPKIEESPSTRYSRMIRDYFWDDLTRSIDEEGLRKSLSDDKMEGGTQRLYVPATDNEGIQYYQELAQKNPQLVVVVLPKAITPQYVKSINELPGMLALALDEGKGVPFVVPGGRFNEMYGWDSYFEGIGLLLDGRVDLAKAMIDNFCYQITHYGKILNANRSYYLTRTQPPFLSSFIRETFDKHPELGISWLEKVLKVAIKEYNKVWMIPGERLISNGLNRYCAAGMGIPPETEEGHFNDVLLRYAKKHKLSLPEFIEGYQSNDIKDQELDTYFTHDRSLRESGHDTSWRLDDCCANLNVVDLNSLLYKYEMDFAYLIKTYFENKLDGETSEDWEIKAQYRKELINQYCWNEEGEQFFDYNFAEAKQTYFQSASNYFPLWAGLCTQEQADKMVKTLFKQLKVKGGIAGTSKAMCDQVLEGAVQRQWDYPNGWAPHQMLIWKGLQDYGFLEEMQELIYRWLWMITKNAVDYNGTIPEKYDVVACTHKVYAEYGNVGTNFDYITTSGFGWMNASYQYGLSLLSSELRSNLDVLIDPEHLFK